MSSRPWWIITDENVNVKLGDQ